MKTKHLFFQHVTQKESLDGYVDIYFQVDGYPYMLCVVLSQEDGVYRPAMTEHLSEGECPLCQSSKTNCVLLCRDRFQLMEQLMEQHSIRLFWVTKEVELVE